MLTKTYSSAHDGRTMTVFNDRFVNCRREQPWIGGNPATASDGSRSDAGMRVVPRDMGFQTGFSISRAAKQAMLKDRGREISSNEHSG